MTRAPVLLFLERTTLTKTSVLSLGAFFLAANLLRFAAMLCAHCGEATELDPCPGCRQPPRLDGKLELLAILGRGGQATTYKARDLASGELVCVKELPFRQIIEPKTLELFRREAAVLAQLDHEQIPRFISHFTAGAGKQRSLYIVQELIDGVDLAHEMLNRRYSSDDVLRVIEEVASILEYLHALHPPVIHRDIKPSNIIRRKNGQLVLSDFGSVRDAVKDPRMGGSTVTGTFGFMAPEQLRADAVPESDVYGLGATALALLTRRPPQELIAFDGQVAWTMIQQLHPAMKLLLSTMLLPDPKLRITALVVGQEAAAARVALSKPAEPLLSRIARGVQAELARQIDRAVDPIDRPLEPPKKGQQGLAPFFTPIEPPEPPPPIVPLVPREENLTLEERQKRAQQSKQIAVLETAGGAASLLLALLAGPSALLVFGPLGAALLVLGGARLVTLGRRKELETRETSSEDSGEEPPASNDPG